MEKNGKKRNVVVVSFTLLWMMFVILTILHGHRDIVTFLRSSWYYNRILFVLDVVLLLASVHYGLKMSEKKYQVVLFAFSFFLSFSFATLDIYIPTNDFKVYYDAAYWFSAYGFREKVIGALQNYKMPGMAGMVIINGTLMKVFSMTVLGMQFINCVFSSITCCLVYLIAKRFSLRGARIAGLVYALYPMRIIWCSVTTNQIGSTCFMLLGVYYWINACEKKSIVRAIISGIFLALSNMYHPSIILLQFSICLYAILELFQNRKKDSVSRWTLIKLSKLKYAFTTVAVSIIIFRMFILLVASIGFWDGETGGTESAVMSKLVWGINKESVGRINQEDIDYLSQFKGIARKKAAKELWIKRAKDLSVSGIYDLYLRKNSNTWFMPDDGAYFLCIEKLDAYRQIASETVDDYVWEANDENLRKLENLYNSLLLSDMLYVDIMWVFVFVLFAKLVKGKSYIDEYMLLIMFIPMSWMAWVTIAEQQARYRYAGMPIVAILASLGVELLYSKITESINKIRK